MLSVCTPRTNPLLGSSDLSCNVALTPGAYTTAAILIFVEKADEAITKSLLLLLLLLLLLHT